MEKYVKIINIYDDFLSVYGTYNGTLTLQGENKNMGTTFISDALSNLFINFRLFVLRF